MTRQTNVPKKTAAVKFVVNSRRGQLRLITMRSSRHAMRNRENTALISGDMDGPLYLAIGRNVDEQALRRFAKRERINAADLIAFKKAIPLPRLSELPSCNPLLGMVARDQMSPEELQMTEQFFKEADMSFVALPSTQFMNKWDFSCAGATRAELLAAGAENPALCYVP